MKQILRTSALLAVLTACLVSCASRYRLDLFLTFEEVRDKIDIRSTQLVMNARIGNPMADDKVVPGDADVLVVTFGSRWQSLSQSDYPVLQFDENLTGILYLELPVSRPSGTEIDLKGSSLVNLLGRYDQPPEAKIFVPVSGTAVIDSVRSDKSYLTVNGRFANGYGNNLDLNGSFRARTSN